MENKTQEVREDIMTQTDRDEKMREALRRAEMKLRAYAGICKDDKELPKVIDLIHNALQPHQQLSEDEAVEIMAKAHYKSELEKFDDNYGIDRREAIERAMQRGAWKDGVSSMCEAYRALLAAQTKDRSDSVPGISQGKEASASFQGPPALRTELANSCEGGPVTRKKE